MNHRRAVIGILGCAVACALAWPAVSPADHVSITATVSARLAERLNSTAWIVEVTWNVTCAGAAPGHENYSGNLNLVDLDTGERIYLGGVSSGSGTARQVVDARERERHLTPELKISCWEDGSLHGAGPIVVTGAATGNVVTVPPRFDDPPVGGSGGDYGSGDPTEPLETGGCSVVLQGTSGPDVLPGTGDGDVIFGYDGDDRIRGGAAPDCLIGGKGDDVLEGQTGPDVLTGGRGNDELIGGPGVNSYNAGPGADRINARNGRRELVRCGSGRDRARVDRRDRVRSCERLSFR